MKTSPAIILYRVPNARPVIIAPLVPGEYTHPHPYNFISNGVVRGSCSCYADREDVTEAVLDGNLELQQVEERCGK